ncbi:Uncharacterized protein FKW44_011501, partial [Caligus rogercresseyi]
MEEELEWTNKVSEIHHGRWMAAAMYVLKMTICGEDRVQMGRRQAKGLLDMANFIIYLYRQYWFAAPTAANALFLTLSLWNDLQKLSARDPPLSAKLKPILDHNTWYLTGRNVFYVLFSDLVDDVSKRKIADAMVMPENT